MKSIGLTTFAMAGLSLVTFTSVAADSFLIDLTHPIGTFKPLNGDITKPDLNSPLLDSIAVPTFGQQAVYDFNFGFKTNQGEFQLGQILLSEHHGTHMDASRHFVNNPGSSEGDDSRRKYMHQMTADDLIGPAVVIDISSRVQAELDKNGGKPSPDASITNFSNASNNVVTAADIDGIS